MSQGNYPQLPKDWKPVPLKHVVSMNPEVLPDSTPADTLLSYVDIAALENGGAELAPTEVSFGAAPSRARRVLRSGDTILSTVRTYLKAVASFPTVESNLIASTGFAVLRPNGTMHARFAYWAALSEPFIENVVAHSDGVSYPAINPTLLGNLPVAVPPSWAQERIANFLDEQTARIDALIADKEKLSVAVREYEQAELSRLTTSGSSPAKLRPTDDSFVREAPTHWRVIAFKRALFGMDQGWSPQCDSRPADADEWGVLKVGCVNGTLFNPAENKALPRELKPDLSCALRKGDVLVSRANTRELVGMAALVWDSFPNLLLCDKLYRLKLNPASLLPEYAVLLLRSDSSRRQIELGASGASSSMQNISQDVLRGMTVALPPVTEQFDIVNRAKVVRLNCDHLVRHIEEHTDRLREYRSSMISAAVTGQLDLGAYKAAA